MQDTSPFYLFGLAAALGVIATWGVRRFALSRGIVNHPNPLIPQHRLPVAYLGGVAVFLAAAGALVAAWVAARLGFAGLAGGHDAAGVPWRVAVPAALFLILGVVDDLVVLRPAPKFAGQFAVAALAAGLGLVYPLTGVRPVDAGLTLFWVVTLVNAFNFTDVCDGLVAGLSIVSLTAVALLHPAYAPVAAVGAGACAGFWLFNRAPATIYLGDAGSHLLGFAVAALVLGPADRPAAGASDGGAARWLPVAQALLVAGVPVFELVFLTVVRVRKGHPWWKGSPDHFALRLQAAGLTRPQTCAVAWVLAAVLGGAAVALPHMGGAARVTLASGVVAGLGLAWRTLLRWEVRPRAVAAPTGREPRPAEAVDDVAGAAVEVGV
jgi:UDP-GlcNAc:undecaprenyl-phosphate GlcNAc-1-phosphate transferase